MHQRMARLLFDPERASILILRMSSLGDVVHALPTLAALRRRFPRARLGWVVRPAVKDLLVGNPCLDEVLVLGSPKQAALAGNGPQVIGLPDLLHPVGLARALRARSYELTLDLQGLLKSSFIAYLSGARWRIGYQSWQEGQFLFNNLRLVPDRKDIHAIWGYLGFAQVLGADPLPIEFPVGWSSQDEGAVSQLLAEKGLLHVEQSVALAPGGTWQSKRWPPESYGEVALTLARRAGLRSVIVGSGVDAERAALIRRVAGEAAVDLTGRTTLKQLAALLKRSALMIGNDTGPMHLAAALGTRTVAILGPTAGERIGPYGEGNAIVASGLACGPCRKRSCPPAGAPACMVKITPQQVVEAALHVFAGRSPQGGSSPVSASAGEGKG